jgi:hypothetical protein
MAHESTPEMDRDALEDLYDTLDRLARRMTRRAFGTDRQMQMDAGNALGVLHRAPIAHRHQLSGALMSFIREVGYHGTDPRRHLIVIESALAELRELLDHNDGADPA